MFFNKKGPPVYGLASLFTCVNDYLHKMTDVITSYYKVLNLMIIYTR